MKTSKIFNLIMAVVFAFSLLGTPLLVVAQEPTLNHRVTVILDYHHAVPWILGEEWSLGAPVTINIDDPNSPESPDFTAQIYAGNIYPEQVGGGFKLSPGYSISPGFIVTVSDGIVTQSLEVYDIQSFSIDGQNDQVMGRTSPNRELSIIVNNIVVQTRSDDVGNWLGSFAGKTDLSWDSLIEIKIFDDNGNLTEWRMTDPKTPIIRAGPNQGFVFGRNWPGGLLVHMTVERSGSIVYASDAIVGPCGAGNPAQPECGPDEVYFDLGYSDTGAPRLDLEPGDMITLAGGEIIRSMIVPALLVTDVDLSTSTITGTADAGMDVLVTACPGTDTRFMVTPDAAGHWTTIAPFDLVLGMGCAVIQTDEYGNTTLQAWAVPELRIEANIMGQWIQAREQNWPPISIWSLGTVLTLTIDDRANGVGVDYTGTATMEQNPDNPGDLNDIRANFDWPAIGLQPGFIVKVSGNDIEKTLIVSPLQVEDIDVQADTISGIASPRANVEVCANIPNNCIRRYVTADSSGNWLANYHDPGTQSDEQETVDIQWGVNGGAVERDEDGDETRIDWYVSNPSFNVSPDDDNMDGWSWPLDATVTIEINDPITPINPDYSTTTSVNPANQNNSTPWFNLDLANVFDLQPGQIVTVFDANITKQTIIAPRSITAVDPVIDTISGVTDLTIKYVIVWACDDGDCGARYQDVNPDGSWFVNFALPGSQGWDNVIFDIQPDTSGGIYQSDNDGDGTVYQQWFLNRLPVITTISAPINPIRLGQSIDATVEFNDPDVGDTHTVTWDWGDGTITTLSVAIPSMTTSHTYTSAGVYTVAATITDAAGESDIQSFQYVVIYDPNGGFVTGGGWINSPAGAYTADETLAGKATFGFVSKYQKGANVPTGNTEFQFHVANMNFKSTSYDWLVIAVTKAQYKGKGTINGAGEYGFMLTAIDGTQDKFRIKIWNKATGEVIYDNQLGAVDTADPATSIQGGSIVVHKEK